MEGLEQTAKLLELIRERGFKPGDKLPSERDLAALFGMSRSAVRESLIRLDTLRIVESRPKSGVYLQPYGAERSIEAMVLFAETNTPLTAAEVAQSVELRSVLESEAMRLACLRRSQEDLDRLQQILRDSAAAIERGESMAEFDAIFHKAIVAATKNDVLLRFINVFYLMSRKRREIYFRETQQGKRSHAQHLQLFAAIEAQDAELGQQILRRHLKGVDAYFRMFFSESHHESPIVKPIRKTAAKGSADGSVPRVVNGSAKRAPMVRLATKR
jgi:GntR family transcriptional regulator, transcriptional repressor for pyruvate dehydrogenase complex